MMHSGGCRLQVVGALCAGFSVSLIGVAFLRATNGGLAERRLPIGRTRIGIQPEQAEISAARRPWLAEPWSASRVWQTDHEAGFPLFTTMLG